MFSRLPNIYFKLFLLVYILRVVESLQHNNGRKRDAEENEHHLLNVLKYHEIIPDIIDDAAHADILTIVYDGDLNVNIGDELTPTEVRDQPIKIYWTAEPTSYYTLLLVDPDAPSRKNARNRSFQHWIVVNIPGDNVAAGETLTEYVGAIPQKGTGLHRYVFLLFEQKNGKKDYKESIITNRDATRDKFSVREFIARHHLNQPIGMNFFQAKFDETVPALLSKFLNLQQDDDDDDEEETL